MDADWIEKVGPLNLTPEEANALLGDLGGVLEQYEKEDHPKAAPLARVERKMHAAIVVADDASLNGAKEEQ